MKKIKFNFKTFSYALFFILLAVSWFFIIVVDEGIFSVSLQKKMQNS